jgi:hypothetical protein
LPVEVDHVVGGLCDPDFGFPGDVVEVAEEPRPVEERGHEHQPRRGACEELFELGHALGVDGSVAGDGFDEDEPVSLFDVEDDVGHLAVLFDGDAELSETPLVEIGPLCLSG